MDGIRQQRPECIARRAREADEAAEVAYLKELYHQNDPEVMIRVFESQPSLNNSPLALFEYMIALVKVDRLDESEFLKTLRRGLEPGTLVGSVVFDLFLIHVVCVVVPKAGELKNIADLGVWLVELFWSFWVVYWLHCYSIIVIITLGYA
ncbi:hypothetical protein VNO80_10319 [Phaseolus coccineus]|uniref:Uncharacterized protein n=1 Tax=Phaseolus coccineus TaxID=3886 RepID=A0AAN9N7W9_PHACN